jgi:Domain of unknown function (DUF4258)
MDRIRVNDRRLSFMAFTMAIVRVIDEEVLGRRKLAFDNHAIQRMTERGVSEDQVIDTLNHPDLTGLPADPPRLRVRKWYPPDVSIDVIYEEDPTQIVVISVTRNVKK